MNEEWFLEEFEARALLGPRRLAIDVGANVGDWSRWMARHFEQVVALEADPRAIDGFRRSGVPTNCILLPVAAGGNRQTSDFCLRNDHRQSSLEELHPIGGGDQREVEVVERRRTAVVTLDDIADLFPADEIDFVKIDVEGSEADVLAGVRGSRYRRARWIIEIHDRAVEVGAELTRLGFDQLLIKKHPLSSAHPNHQWIFLPPLEQGA